MTSTPNTSPASERVPEMVERYCRYKGCPGGDGCINLYRQPGSSCTMEYVAAACRPEFRWRGEGPPPASWWVGNTRVYRTFSDYCDD